MQYTLKHSKHLHYADDTTIYLTGTDINSLHAKMNEDLKSIHDWCQANSLFLNAQKSKSICFFPRQNTSHNNLPPIHMNNIPAQIVPDMNFLGLTISSDLSWAKHVKQLNTKISHGLYALNKTKNILPKRQKQLIYTSLIDHTSLMASQYGDTHTKNIFSLSLPNRKKQYDTSTMLHTMHQHNRSSNPATSWSSNIWETYTHWS